MKVSNKEETMFTVQTLMKIFLAVLFATAALALCTTDVEAKKGTRVDVGAHINFTSGASLNMLVTYVNPSDRPITIKEIKIFRPDGILEVDPNFLAAGLTTPPFDLGPFESKGFLLEAVGIGPISIPPPPFGWFQVYTYWDSQQATAGLKSWSVITGNNGLGGVSRTSQEGFNLPDRGDRDD